MRRGSKPARMAAAAICALLLVSCGGDDMDGDDGADASVEGAGDDGGDATGPTGTLPAECQMPPYTVAAFRDGEIPAGSEQFEVVSAVAVEIPIVPNGSDQLTLDEVFAQQETTDLVGYAILFADEMIDESSVSLFGGWDPVGEGKTRGNVGVYPNSTTPLAAGDKITPGMLDGLDLITTLKRIGMDLKATDGISAYLDDPVGSVTILGLTDDAICLDVDLSWEYGDFGIDALGTLTIKGVFAAEIVTRTMSLN